MNAEARDALPDLLHGRLSELDTATMKAHVESCADCRAELEIIREAMGSVVVPKMDASKIAAAIAPYAAVNLIPARRSVFRNVSAIRIAAALGLVAIGGYALSNVPRDDAADVRQTASASAATRSVAAPAATGDVTTPLTNEAITASGPAEDKVASLSLVGSTAELSDSDLEQLVAELDGMETLPSLEPQTITITDEDLGTANDTLNQ